MKDQKKRDQSAHVATLAKEMLVVLDSLSKEIDRPHSSVPEIVPELRAARAAMQDLYTKAYNCSLVRGIDSQSAAFTAGLGFGKTELTFKRVTGVDLRDIVEDES